MTENKKDNRMEGKEEKETWKWQEPGTAWRGAGLYHITLVVADRQPWLGRLVTPGDDVAHARVVRTPLGDALIDCLLSIPHHHPEVQVLHFCLMPDHLHAVLYVRRTMPIGIGTLVRGFWQATKKLGRACTLANSHGTAPSSLVPNGPAARPALNDGNGTAARPALNDGNSTAARPAPNGTAPSFVVPNDIREALKEGSRRLQALAAALREQMGDTGYYGLAPVFAEKPFIRPMVRYAQLPTTIRYLDMNPQRLATKRLRPGFFRVQRGIAIGDRTYDGVGNVAVLMSQRYATVHVRRTLVEQAQHGETEPLRQYKNGCVLKAREGVVMVSPFISPDEKQVLQVLLREGHPVILLTDNGFRDYYKPANAHFDACAQGRLLILSPWPYDGGKRHITRADCVALNAMAEDICYHLHATAHPAE